MISSRDTLPLAVVLDRDDARDLLRARPACRAVLALTPAARAALKDSPVPVLSTLPFYTSIGHRRTVLHQRRAIAELEVAFEHEPELSPSAREALIIVLFYITATSARLATTLRQEGPLLVNSTRGWTCYENRDAAQSLLLARILNDHYTKTLWQKFGTPPLPGIATLLCNLTARLYRGRGPVVFGYGRRLLNRLGEKIVAANPDRPVLSVKWTRGRWSDYPQIARSLLHAAKGEPRGELYAMPLRNSGVEDAAARALKAVRDPAARAGIDAAHAILLRATSVTAGMALHLHDMFDVAGPSALVTDSLGWGVGGAAGEAAQELDIPVLFISHASHGEQSTPVSSQAVGQWIRHGRVCSRFASILLPKTPHAARAAASIEASCGNVPQAAYTWIDGVAEAKSSPDGTFRILQACNLSPWGSYVPWAMQTGDEFLNGILQLAEIVSRRDDLALVVRPKRKGECDAQVLAALVPETNNVEVRDGGLFAEDLAACDLVVAYSSSTIEEALHARKPVLLWGGGVAYEHLPARKDLPSETDRAAVYVATTKADLKRLLPAIAAAHKGRPLSDMELERHLWPLSTPSTTELAFRLAHGDLPMGTNSRHGDGDTNSMSKTISRRALP